MPPYTEPAGPKRPAGPTPDNGPADRRRLAGRPPRAKPGATPYTAANAAARSRRSRCRECTETHPARRDRSPRVTADTRPKRVHRRTNDCRRATRDNTTTSGRTHDATLGVVPAQKTCSLRSQVFCWEGSAYQPTYPRRAPKGPAVYVSYPLLDFFSHPGSTWFPGPLPRPEFHPLPSPRGWLFRGWSGPAWAFFPHRQSCGFTSAILRMYLSRHAEPGWSLRYVS